MGRKPDYLARVAVVAVALAGGSACASREARFRRAVDAGQPVRGHY